MLKKLLFFISLVVFLNQINLTFAEIVPLKKPIQTQEQKEQKLLSINQTRSFLSTSPLFSKVKKKFFLNSNIMWASQTPLT